MSDSNPISPEVLRAVRTHFFRKLGEIDHDVIQGLIDLLIQINEQDHRICLSLLMDAMNELQRMQNILTVFEECF